MKQLLTQFTKIQQGEYGTTYDELWLKLSRIIERLNKLIKKTTDTDVLHQLYDLKLKVELHKRSLFIKKCR